MTYTDLHSHILSKFHETIRNLIYMYVQNVYNSMSVPESNRKTNALLSYDKLSKYNHLLVRLFAILRWDHKGCLCALLLCRCTDHKCQLLAIKLCVVYPIFQAILTSSIDRVWDASNHAPFMSRRLIDSPNVHKGDIKHFISMCGDSTWNVTISGLQLPKSHICPIYAGQQCFMLLARR
jgi:hypothetical protein